MTKNEAIDDLAEKIRDLYQGESMPQAGSISFCIIFRKRKGC